MRKIFCCAMAALVCLASGLLGSMPAAQGVQLFQDHLVSDDPANFTPHVLDGSVKSIQQIGGMILIGGEFSQVQSRDGATTYTRHNLAAFDATTGQISTAFVPDPDGEVTTIIPAGDGTSVFIGGWFNNVSGGGSPGVARINATTGAKIAGFKPPKLNGYIKDLRLSGGRLWIAGLFSQVAGVNQAALATVNPATGAYDPYMSLAIAGTHNGGVTTVTKLDVTPDGGELVAIGNFDTIQSVKHHQVFMLNLTGQAAAVENWQTNFYNQACSSSFQTYMRDVDISPDGSYFVITTTGAYGGSLSACDSSARFDVAVRGSALTAKWIDNTGGDTTYAVAITGTVVYTGGHSRWQNNPFAGDRAGQGAVSRPGIAALDPVNGLPLSWNPTRDRGVGVFDLLATTTGLWVGSDTDRIGQGYEYHARIAYFPLAGGKQVTPGNTPVLPDDVYVAGRRSGTSYDDTVSRSAYDGTTAAPLASRPNGGLAWRNNRGAFMLNGQLYSGWSDGSFNRRGYDGTTFGTATPVNTGDLLVNMTTWHSEVQSITGMFFDAGRIYYTMSGSSSLFYRYVTPESDVVGANRFTASASLTGIDFSRVNGMFLAGSTAGSTLYFTNSSDANLRRATWNSATGQPVAGTAQTLSTGIDWRARTLFLYQDVDGLGPNQPPVASFGESCGGLTCTFDGSGSTDPDGSIASFAWNFGDGTTGTGATPQHRYGAGGTYTVQLTVTDTKGGSGTTSHQVTVTQATSAIEFAGSGHLNANASQFTVTVPAGVVAGDALLLFFADNDPAASITGPAGWTLVENVASSGQAGRLWRRTATGSDAGSAVQVATSALVKADLTLLAYRGTAANPVAVSAAGSETVSQTGHTTPTVSTSVSGGRLVSYWGEKSSSTTTLTPPAGVTAREASTGTGSGRITALAADSTDPVQPGTAGGLTATADTASAKALMFTVVLAP